jgi:hypothetical protein
MKLVPEAVPRIRETVTEKSPNDTQGGRFDRQEKISSRENELALALRASICKFPGLSGGASIRSDTDASAGQTANIQLR